MTDDICSHRCNQLGSSWGYPLPWGLFHKRAVLIYVGRKKISARFLFHEKSGKFYEISKLWAGGSTLKEKLCLTTIVKQNYEINFGQ